MRAAIFTAAFAAAAYAIPHKRDLVVVVETDTDIVYVTQVVTVTAGAGDYIPAVVATTSAAVPSVKSSTTDDDDDDGKPTGHAHHNWHHPGNGLAKPDAYSTTTTTSPSSVVVATSTSVYVAPPAPFSEAAPSTSTQKASPLSTQAPPSTSSKAAPTTSAAPATVAAPSPSPASPSPANSVDAEPASPTGYNELVVAHHNLHRANHSAPPMVWDEQLASTARAIAASCIYAHNVDQDRAKIGAYGQNIAAGVPDNNITAIITDLFYNGEVNYYNGLYGQDSPDMTNFEEWGHFSQIVWHNTSKVGCATQHCPAGLANTGSNVNPWFTVCNYQSPGNYANEYTQVGRPLGYPTVEWNYYS